MQYMGETEFHRLVNVTGIPAHDALFPDHPFLIYQKKAFAALQNFSPVV
jgi:hypothetical protein